MKWSVNAVACASLAAVLVLAGCTREERSLNAHAMFTIERVPNGVRALEMESRIHDTQLAADEFDQAWAVVTRGVTTGAGLAFSMGSVGMGSTETTLLVGLTLVVPTPLRAGSRFPITHALPAPREMPMYWSTWGRRTLRDAGNAGIALRAFDYRPVGMVIENEFIAESASGAVDVVSTSGDQVVLRLAVTLTNTTGQIVRLNGDVTLFAERYRPPIT